MGFENRSANDVKNANRIFYNSLASDYEQFDGRRSPELEKWLTRKLHVLRKRVSGGNLLDIGSGSGLVTRCAKGIFKQRIGMDISHTILSLNKGEFDSGVASDADHLPFADNSFDVVTCFAALHHMYGFEQLLSEVKRVLKPGGYFYSDHDMDRMFYNRFCLLINLYRMASNAKTKYVYLDEKKGLSSEIYKLTEFHENGIESDRLTTQFKKLGFDISVKYHWFGLFKYANLMIGKKTFKRGLAPILSVCAQKLSV